MGRHREEDDPDRHLLNRGGNFYYKRRVPQTLVDIDPRGAILKISLKTKVRGQARAKRDALEQADNDYWEALLSGGDAALALARYQATKRRAEAMGFSYKPAAVIAEDRLSSVIERIEAVMDVRTPDQTIDAILGGVQAPPVLIDDAMTVYINEIKRAETRLKSPDQYKRWKNKKKASVRTFIDIIGKDKPISDITRDDALKLYNFWLARIAPKEGSPTHSASSGNRDLGNLRSLYDEYFKHLNVEDIRNPFANLFFNEKKGKRKRLPFATEWIAGKIMALGALAGLNDEARGIVLGMIETGARPGELCTLTKETIILDAPIPHIVISPSDDPDDPWEIKTESSVREVPLVGISLEVFKRNPSGFPKYKDKGATLSATVNKYMKKHDLFPTKRHKLYSLRHSFEDRMKDGHVDSEVRKILMGHTINRPEYGKGGSMKLWHDYLKRIALPFDPSIV